MPRIHVIRRDVSVWGELPTLTEELINEMKSYKVTVEHKVKQSLVKDALTTLYTYNIVYHVSGNQAIYAKEVDSILKKILDKYDNIR